MYYLTWTERRLCAAYARDRQFSLSLFAAVLPPVKHPIITEPDMNFCEYAPIVMIHVCSVSTRIHIYISREGQARSLPRFYRGTAIGCIDDERTMQLTSLANVEYNDNDVESSSRYRVSNRVRRRRKERGRGIGEKREEREEGERGEKGRKKLLGFVTIVSFA